jgi:hypothetical protein
MILILAIMTLLGVLQFRRRAVTVVGEAKGERALP